jgi:hypothetical protein
VGINPTRGVIAEHAVSLRDEQVRAVLREDGRDETAMKKRLGGKVAYLSNLHAILEFINIY